MATQFGTRTTKNILPSLQLSSVSQSPSDIMSTDRIRITSRTDYITDPDPDVNNNNGDKIRF